MLRAVTHSSTRLADDPLVRLALPLLPLDPTLDLTRPHRRSVTVIAFIFVGIEGIATELEMVRPALPFLEVRRRRSP